MFHQYWLIAFIVLQKDKSTIFIKNIEQTKTLFNERNNVYFDKGIVIVNKVCIDQCVFFF